jgi:putative restriction endonuclease
MNLIEKIDAINVYKKGTNRAPHKPLYLLFLLASHQKDMPRMMPFCDVSRVLTEALRLFGQRTASVNPEYPFWRLQNDGLSEVVPASPSAYELRQSNNDPKKSSLLKNGAKGGLIKSDFDLLAKHPELFNQACHRILDHHFPASIHEDLLDFFGIDLGFEPAKPDHLMSHDFRSAVLLEYGFRCAISGFQSSPAVKHAGIESAELVWRNHGGPSTVSNAIAMTTLHRKLFHLGLFTIDDDYTVRLSPDLGIADSVGLKNGRSMSLPSSASLFPSLTSLAWHRRWVFRG